MNVQLDIQKPKVARDFSKILLKQSKPLEIEIGDVDFCPNRIVPIVALADLHRRNGGHVSFAPYNGVAAKAACAGFVSSQMNPSEVITRPFGRVWRFDNSDEMEYFVNAADKELLKTVRLAPGVRLCFLWCLNEVMDNVLRHSRKSGAPFGYVMVQYVDAEKLLKACVFDVGIGLKESFVGSKYSPETPSAAIRLAVGENITSGSGQGNGLYGLKCLVNQSPCGRLHIRSAGGEYLYETSTLKEVDRPSWTLEGYSGTTTIDFQVHCDGELSFEKVFPAHQGLVDLWTEAHETDEGRVHIKVSDISHGCGSRESGKEVRTLVENYVETDKRRVILDFENIETCSSGFVDELIGKLIEKYGFVTCSQSISVVHITGIAALLINHSVAQRLARQETGLQVADSSGESRADDVDSTTCPEESCNRDYTEINDAEPPSFDMTIHSASRDKTFKDVLELDGP